MGFFKSLKDKLQEKTDEAKEKAAKAAADMAIDRSKRAAKAAYEGTAKKIEEALFGDSLREEEEKPKSEKPDPFAKLKAQEAQKKAEARAAREKAVEDELAALKKRLQKK